MKLPISPLKKLRLLKAGLTVVKDPTNTSELFSIMDTIRVENSQIWQALQQGLSQHQENMDCIRQRRPFPVPTREQLFQYAPNTLGYQYGAFLEKNNLDVIFYPRLDEQTDFNYYGMRVRQTHDLWHVLTGFDTSTDGELGLLAVYLQQLNSPLAEILLGLGFINQALYHPKNMRNNFEHVLAGWHMGKVAKQLFPLPFEELFDHDLQELQRELRIVPFTSPAPTLEEYSPSAVLPTSA